MIDNDKFRRELYEALTGNKSDPDIEKFNAQCKELSDYLGTLVNEKEGTHEQRFNQP